MAAVLMVGSGSALASTESDPPTAAPCAGVIGVIAPYGAGQANSTVQLNWARVALDQFNKDNGTSFTISPANVGSTEVDRGVVEAQRLAADEKIIGVVGPSSSLVTKSVGPVLDAAGLSYVSPSATATVLTEGSLSNFFRVVANDSVQGPSIAQFIESSLKPKKVLVVVDDEPYSIGLAKGVVRTLKAKGVKVSTTKITLKQKDMSSVAQAVTPSTNVLVLPILLPEDGVNIVNAVRDSGKFPAIVAGDSMFSLTEFNVPGAYVSSFAPDVSITPQGKDTIKLYGQIFDDLAPYGGPAYVAMEVVLTAARKTCVNGSTTRAKVTKALPDVRLDSSILGQPLAFDANHDVVDGVFWVYRHAADSFQPMTRAGVDK